MLLGDTYCSHHKNAIWHLSQETFNLNINSPITQLFVSMSRHGSAPSHPLSYIFISYITAVLLALEKRSLGGNEAWQENKEQILNA